MQEMSFKSLGSFLMWVVAPLIIGMALAQQMLPQPAVGIVRLNSDIWSGSADLVLRQLQAAKEDPNIKAVVLEINSPGGEVVATQIMYEEVLALRQEMPVVGTIEGIAASGGYYLALSTSPLYAQPSSTVGNIGVWGFVPSDVAVNDVILASGPFKLTASNQAEFLREIEGIKQEFIATVITQRGESLVAEQSELAQGLAYPGREALRLGLVDDMGSRTEAVIQAAEMAGIAHYRTINLEEQIILELIEAGYYGETWLGAADPLTGERNLPPGLYLLYDGLRR